MDPLIMAISIKNIVVKNISLLLSLNMDIDLKNMHILDVIIKNNFWNKLDLKWSTLPCLKTQLHTFSMIENVFKKLIPYIYSNKFHLGVMFSLNYTLHFLDKNYNFWKFCGLVILYFKCLKIINNLCNLSCLYCF